MVARRDLQKIIELKLENMNLDLKVLGKQDERASETPYFTWFQIFLKKSKKAVDNGRGRCYYK